MLKPREFARAGVVAAVVALGSGCPILETCDPNLLDRGGLDAARMELVERCEDICASFMISGGGRPTGRNVEDDMICVCEDSQAICVSER